MRAKCNRSLATLTHMPRISLTKNIRLVAAAFVAAVALGALVAPASAATAVDCKGNVLLLAKRGPIQQWFPNACYVAAISDIPKEDDYYARNIKRNIQSAQRRDRVRKLTFTAVKRTHGRAIVLLRAPVIAAFATNRGAGNVRGISFVAPHKGGIRFVTLRWNLGKHVLVLSVLRTAKH